MFDLISIGDTIVDTYVPLLDAEVIEKGRMMYLELPFAAKIAVDESTSLIGGNAANNVVGASRLGLKSAIYTNVGKKDGDIWDNRIVANFKKEKVDIRYVSESDEFTSDHNIILDFKGERTILVYHHPWKYKLPDLDKTRWVYFSSVSPSFVKGDLVSELENYLQRSGSKLIYSPGTQQLKFGVKKFPKLLSLSEVFILNLQEAKIALGFPENAKIEIKKLLSKICDLGPKIAVITDAHNGSYAYDGIKFYKMAIFPAKMKEMTGAGDAFATGFLAGLFYSKTLDQALRWGAANSASVVEQVGAQEGLLTYEKMQQRLKENVKIEALEI